MKYILVVVLLCSCSVSKKTVTDLHKVSSLISDSSSKVEEHKNYSELLDSLSNKQSYVKLVFSHTDTSYHGPATVSFGSLGTFDTRIISSIEIGKKEKTHTRKQKKDNGIINTTTNVVTKKDEKIDQKITKEKKEEFKPPSPNIFLWKIIFFAVGTLTIAIIAWWKKKHDKNKLSR